MRLRLAFALAFGCVAFGASAQTHFFAASHGRDILARELTAGELATLGRETSEIAVIRKLVQSTETQALQAPVVRLYLSCFDRIPDYEGFDFYVEALSSGKQTLDDMADEIAGSEEFGLRYGTVENAMFVQLIYRHVFQRPPGPDTLRYWTAQLDGGASRAYVLLRLSESPENIYAREREVDQFIAAARLLHRTPERLDPAAPLDDYIEALLRRVP